jgi:hypothetical protein
VPAQKKQDLHELVTVTRGLVLATCLLAVVGFLSFVASVLQWLSMRGQLEEMKTETSIRRYELRANMELKIEPEHSSDKWFLTTKWVNVGKTDAINVKGWSEIANSLAADEVKRGDFIGRTDTRALGEGRTVIPGDAAVYPSKELGLEQAWDIVYERRFSFIWGYVEFNDIFGKSYTARYCALVVLREQGGNNVVMDSPVMLHTGCNQRTEK